MNYIQIINNLWIEKYRPQSLDDMVISEDSKNKIEQFAKEGIIPNIFLCSRPGQGKTSLAKVIAYQLMNADVLYLNASEQNNVDVVRDVIADFSRTMPTPGKDFKIVILDEVDGFASDKAQKLLRGLMEEAADNTRFILTANYRNKVIEALRSRCLSIDISPDIKGIVKRCIYICQQEGVTGVTKEVLGQILAMVKRYYPDVRSIVKTLQSSVNANGELVIKEYAVESVLLETIVNKVLGDSPMDIRNYVIDNEPSFNSDYYFLMTELYKYVIDREDIAERVRAMFTIKLSECLSRFSGVIDPELNTAACLFEMWMINKKETGN